MVKNKNRKMKRKEGLRKNNDEEKRKKDKDRQKRQETARPVKKIRILADGSIGFGHKAKLGRTGLIVIVTVSIGLIFFMGGINGWYDQFAPDDFNTQLTFEYCKSIDFNDDLCILDYRFCRDYADGETLCQYAETDPFVDVDPNERKYTEEEQDFLPPSSVITDFIFGWFPQQAHADERNHFTIGIYKSNSCKAQTRTGFGSCPTNELLAKEFDNTNQAMSGEFVWSDYDNDVYRVPPKFIHHYNFYQYAGLPIVLAVDPDVIWFKCCMDAQIFIEPSGFVYYDNNLAADTTIWENDEEKRLIQDRVKEVEKIREPEPVYYYENENDHDLDNDGILDENDNCIREKEDYNGFEDQDGCPDDRDKDTIKGANDKCPNEKEDFNGFEDDDGCIDDYDNDGIVGNKCDTFEYRQEYQRIHANDKDPKTRTVPDNCYIDLDECPNDPETYNRFEDDDGCPDLSENTGELITYKNVYIEGCSFARVTANMTLITETINYFWNNCEGESPEIIEYTYIPSIPINYDDHVWYKFTEWINQKMSECRVKC